MEKKIGLNNVQRKMLDEIYTERFNVFSSQIISDRQIEDKKLCDKILKEESKSKRVKDIFKTFEDLGKLIDKSEEFFEKNGLKIDNLPYRRDDLELRIRSSYEDCYTHPKLKVFREKTNKIKQELAQKKKEIRARIYGMDTTYEEVESEIEKYIGSIKL